MENTPPYPVRVLQSRLTDGLQASWALLKIRLCLFLIFCIGADAEPPWSLQTPLAPPSGVASNLLPYPRQLAWGAGDMPFTSIAWDARALPPELATKLEVEWMDVA